MLVPTVLRSIVLPYLRGTVVAVSHSSAATACPFSTAGARARAAEAAARAQDGIEEPFQHWSSPPRHVRTRLVPPPEPPRLRSHLRELGGHDQQPRLSLDHEDADSSRDSRRVPSQAAVPSSSKSPPPSPSHPSPAPSSSSSHSSHQSDLSSSRTGSTDSSASHRLSPEPHSTMNSSTATRGVEHDKVDPHGQSPRVQVPPAVAQFLRTKLYRMAVFHLLAEPAFASDTALIAYVAEELERKSAGKLARRLRQSLEAPRFAADGSGRVRLWSEPTPADTPRKPPTYWRLPLVRREAYPEPTVTERRTHHYNLVLTALLKQPHAVPYAARLPAAARTMPRARLRRLQDVLDHIAYLREHRDFVPDRVTANIVIKAWLQCLARGTEGAGPGARAKDGRVGLERSDLRDIFAIVARSIEEGARSQSAPKAGIPADSEEFDGRVDYMKHVLPFASHMCRAMARIGDRDGRTAVERWMEKMAKLLGEEKTAIKGGEGKKGKHPKV